MSGNTRHWTTQELELYHDGELDSDRRAELSGALRRDPALRERFATVCRVDDRLRTAWLADPMVQNDRSRTVNRFSRRTLAAACVLMAGGLTWWFGSDRGSSREMSLAQRPVNSDTMKESAYHSIRVVFSIPIERMLNRPSDEHQAETPAQPTAPEDVQAFLARLDGTLAAGRIDDTLDLLDVASTKQRSVAYLRIGALLRSPHAAEKILERLSPSEQLTVCGLWAREPVAQPTVFERLRRFSTQADLSESVRAIVADLAEDPGLRPWLQGYQLVDPNTFRSTGSG